MPSTVYSTVAGITKSAYVASVGLPPTRPITVTAPVIKCVEVAVVII